jgi:hypothetical protein
MNIRSSLSLHKVWFLSIAASFNRWRTVRPLLIGIWSKHTVWLVVIRIVNARLKYNTYNTIIRCLGCITLFMNEGTRCKYYASLTFPSLFTFTNDVSHDTSKHCQVHPEAYTTSPTGLLSSILNAWQTIGVLSREVWHCSWEREKKKTSSNTVCEHPDPLMRLRMAALHWKNQPLISTKTEKDVASTKRKVNPSTGGFTRSHVRRLQRLLSCRLNSTKQEERSYGIKLFQLFLAKKKNIS